MIHPFWGWDPKRSMGKSPRILFHSIQSTDRTHHSAHYSLRQQLISEPACVEEMMRGVHGCRKTFSGLLGAGCRVQSEITLVPRTASPAQGTGSIPT